MATKSEGFGQVPRQQTVKNVRLCVYVSITKQIIKRQYTDNLDCYASVTAAESAIGMDHLRGKRVASWIRFQSSDLLETYENDAKEAFNALVRALFQTVGRPIHESDEIAVRYFLATHLSRCNVFPNPS